MQKDKKLKFEKGECRISYDAKALFISVPVDPTVNIIENKLEQNAELQNRAFMSIPNIIALLGFCLKNTYFLFQGKYY